MTKDMKRFGDFSGLWKHWPLYLHTSANFALCIGECSSSLPALTPTSLCPLIPFFENLRTIWEPIDQTYSQASRKKFLIKIELRSISLYCKPLLESDTNVTDVLLDSLKH